MIAVILSVCLFVCFVLVLVFLFCCKHAPLSLLVDITIFVAPHCF